MGKRQERQARIEVCRAAETDAWNQRAAALGALEAAAEAHDPESSEVRAAAAEFARAHRKLMKAIRDFADAWDDAHPRREEP